MPPERGHRGGGTVAGEARRRGIMERLRGEPRRGADMTRFAVILLVTHQAAVTVPGSDLAVTAGPEEVGVVARHLRVVTGSAGLLGVAHHAGLFIEHPDLAVRVTPLGSLVGLRLGLLVAALALLSRVANRAIPLVDPLGFAPMDLPEVRAAVPVGGCLTVQCGVAHRAVVRAQVPLAQFGEKGRVISPHGIGGHRAGGRGLVASHATLRVRGNSFIIRAGTLK